MNKVQSDFFEDIIAEKIAVTVFLINGVKLQGIITKQDVDSLTNICDLCGRIGFKLLRVERVTGAEL